MERVTVNLTDKTHAALLEAAQLTESNRTTVINKAINLYLFMAQMGAAGGDIYIRERPDGAWERIIIL